MRRLHYASLGIIGALSLSGPLLLPISVFAADMAAAERDTLAPTLAPVDDAGKVVITETAADPRCLLGTYALNCVTPKEGYFFVHNLPQSVLDSGQCKATGPAWRVECGPTPREIEDAPQRGTGFDVPPPKPIHEGNNP